MSIELVTIWIICISTILTISNAYFLSTHALEWLNASNYCLSYCNSHLASVHSASQHLETLDLINHNPNIYTRVWLGLNDIAKSDHWQWSDGTPFDFGGTTHSLTGSLIQGQYPWRGDEPDFNDSDQCVALEVGSNYINANSQSWVDRKLTANYQFFCNDCSSKMHKYAAINGARNYTEAEEICGDKFGTSLASIHNQQEMMEARMVCKQLTSSNGCWLGLTEKGNRIYEWSDGTEWDYGKILHEYPWYVSEPGTTSDQPCTFLDPSNGNDPGEYLWDDYWCHLKKPRALCNAPSEICYPDQFTIIKGSRDDWLFSREPCGMTGGILEGTNIALLSNKQYINTAGILNIDMMYSMLSVGIHGNAGIALYFDENNCKNYYYVGIWGGHKMIFLSTNIESSDPNISEWNLISHTTITNIMPYSLSTQYTLSIQLTHGTEWNIYLNKNLMLTVSDNQFNNANNIYSGHIAIRNVNANINVKSFYISGNVKYENNNNNNLWQMTCTDKPTTSPTNIPTTIIPTNIPTKIPSINPTQFPSDTPSGEPTLNPTKVPSDNTNAPSVYPTKMPSDIPTINPTLEPTVKITNNPTRNPIQSWTFNPTKTPTKKITILPTITKSNNENINTRNPTLNIYTTSDNINDIMYENANVTQYRNQLIWIVGIPIGFIFFCVFGVYLGRFYYFETQNLNKNDNKNQTPNSLEIKISENENENENINGNNNNNNETMDENDDSEKNLLIGSNNNENNNNSDSEDGDTDISNEIDDENNALNEPIYTNDENNNNSQNENENGEIENNNNNNQNENENIELEHEMAVKVNKNDNNSSDASDNENENENENDNEDDSSSDILETMPLNYRMKGYK